MNIAQDARNSVQRSAQLLEREAHELPREERIRQEQQLIDNWLRLYAIDQGLNPYPSHTHPAPWPEPRED